MTTVNELIKRYGIRKIGDKIAVDNAFLAKKENKVEEIKSRKPEIMAILIKEEESKKRAYEERKKKIAEIEGLAEIKNAINDLKMWREEFNNSFDDVGGLDVRPKPECDIEAMKKKYPRANAYLKAECEANKYNYQLSAIGNKALEKIINDPNGYDDAISEMEAVLLLKLKSHLKSTAKRLRALERVLFIAAQTLQA